MAARTRADETRDGVELTSLDGPLFDDAWTSGAEGAHQARPRRLPRRRPPRDPARARRPRAVRGAGPARAAAVHAEEPAQVRPGLDRPHDGLGRGVAPRDRLPALRRPPHAAVAGQPARRRVPPRADQGRGAARHAPGARPRPARGRRRSSMHVVRAAMLVRRALDDLPASSAPSRPAAARASTSSCRSRRCPSRTRPRRPGRSPPAPRRSTRRSPRPRSSGPTAQGKVFLDSTRSIGATVVAAYSPRIRPGLPVSFPVSWDELPHVPRATSRRDGAGPASATATRGPRRCRRRRCCPPTWSRTGTRIPVARVRRCTRASGGSGPGRRDAARRRWSAADEGLASRRWSGRCSAPTVSPTLPSCSCWSASIPSRCSRSERTTPSPAAAASSSSLARRGSGRPSCCVPSSSGCGRRRSRCGGCATR